MLDQYGRKIEYLRVSVTDKCNFRCVYCMPEEGVELKPREELLTFEELVTVIRAGAELGIKHIRLTGGEPTVRKDLVELVRQIKAVPGIEDIALSTNGFLLPELAQPLKAAGVDRVNISLDTLNPERFRQMTRRGDLNKVWAGIEAAFAAGMTPVKLNAVVIKGFNDDEICDLAALSIDRELHMRFIEVMPLSEMHLWIGDGLVPVAEMREKLLEKWDIQPLRDPGFAGAGPAKYWQIPGARGTVGFISAVTECFCAGCNRVRLSSDGQLNPCLGHVHVVDLKPALRGGTYEQLKEQMIEGILRKPKEHNFDDINSDHILRVMVQIGG